MLRVSSMASLQIHVLTLDVSGMWILRFLFSFEGQLNLSGFIFKMIDFLFLYCS